MVLGIDNQKFDYRDISMPHQAHVVGVRKWCFTGSLRPKDDPSGTEMGGRCADVGAYHCLPRETGK